MNKEERIKLAKKSLKGLSIGDAFGDSFFGETRFVLQQIESRIMPTTKWEFTDDTVMAIAVFEELELRGKIDQNTLAKRFAENHNKDVNRGYGATARRILREIGEGGDWQEISKNVFEGMGSMGNGASMRVSPIGAYYFDDLNMVKEQCVKSAEITHNNIEGICGAIAVGIGTALATRSKIENERISSKDFLEQVLDKLPESDTKSKIGKSLQIPYSYHIETVKSILGNGSKILAQDTVPYSLWCVSNNLENFEESLWKGVSILGDRDTICAIVGGISVMSSKEANIPENWINWVEDYERSEFRRELE